MKEIITVDISDMKIASSPNVLATYALGSCVGICIYDPIMKIGALGHIMLPTCPNSKRDDSNNTNRFADTCIPSMLKELLKRNCYKVNLVATIIGGATMFKNREVSTNTNLSNIGNNNVFAVKRSLEFYGIPIIEEHTGEDYARTVYFNTEDGSISIKNSNREIGYVVF